MQEDLKSVLRGTCLKAADVYSAEGAVGWALVVVAQGDGTLDAHAVAAARNRHIGLPAVTDGALLILIIARGHLMVTCAWAQEPGQCDVLERQHWAQPPASIHCTKLPDCTTQICQTI